MLHYLDCLDDLATVTVYGTLALYINYEVHRYLDLEVLNLHSQSLGLNQSQYLQVDDLRQYLQRCL